MPVVMVDGIRYIPATSAPDLPPDVAKAVGELTAMLYRGGTGPGLATAGSSPGRPDRLLTRERYGDTI